VALSNSVTGRLYINGTNVATGSITITPDQLNAANGNTNTPQNYLARGAGSSLPFFQGALDGVRIYTGPLTDAEIGSLQPPPTLATAGTLYVDLRATNAASSSLATFTTWTNWGSGVGNFTKTGTTTYSTNVAGTGISGVLFNGTTALYSSTNTSITDITGASDRTIEVWVYNPALASEETMVSLGDRSGTRSQQLGLVIMDEAFSKLSGDGIEDCLALAKSFQLQLVMAFPPERLGVMVPHAQTVIMCQKEVERDADGYVTSIDNIPLLTTMVEAMDALT